MFSALKEAADRGTLSHIFILCAQVLYMTFKYNKEIKGIIFNNTEIKLTQFADDNTFAEWLETP